MLSSFRIFVIILAFTLLTFSTGNAQQPADGENEFRLAAVGKLVAGPDTITADAGRGVWVADNPDLDNDGKPEIIVTEYTKGGRVFVFEVIGDDQIEYVWSSTRLGTGSGGGSTPRSVTVGDFDNNGRQEIIFPVGYTATDSAQFASRGLYFFEWTGIDNDYGTEPTYKISYESIDPGFETVNVGRTESGLRVQDIDGDGRNELLFPPRAFSFAVAKLYIMQVTSGLLADSTAVIENEYVYDNMVTVPALPQPDGYVPVGTEIGDVDGDELDEIIVAGWTNISSGAGIGFIQIDGEDAYTPGSIIPLTTDFSAFVVKANPRFTIINDEPVIFIHGTNSGTSESKIWLMEGIISDQFVTEANISELFPNRGFWSAWDIGDQDHPTDSPGDGLDLYLYGGGGRLLDIEYDGSGAITDTNSYSIKRLFNLSDYYSNLGGLFNDIFTYPGMDLDDDGRRDVVASYKGSAGDSLGELSLAKFGFHVFMFEWGDSLASVNLDSVLTGFEVKELTIISPDDYRLEQNYPNPFNPSTTIAFSLPINKTVSLRIYNTLGQTVRTLINQVRYTAGSHSMEWDGKNASGQAVASGVYIYELKFGNFRLSKKMTIVR